MFRLDYSAKSIKVLSQAFRLGIYLFAVGVTLVTVKIIMIDADKNKLIPIYSCGLFQRKPLS